MWAYLVIFGVAVVFIGSIIVLSKKLGAVKADRNTALKIAAEKIRDAEITAKPYINDPLDKL
jgi:hypothetical protein